MHASGAARDPFKKRSQASFLSVATELRQLWFQVMRDEDAAFQLLALSGLRTRRSADIRKNPLDEIEGIGPARKKALLHRFGSAKAIARAKLSDIATVDGINQAMAERIYSYFHGS